MGWRHFGVGNRCLLEHRERPLGRPEDRTQPCPGGKFAGQERHSRNLKISNRRWRTGGGRVAESLRHKVAPSVAMRISGPMEDDKTKTASRSKSKRSTNRKPATSRAPAATKAAGRAKRTKTAAKRSPATQAAELSAQPRAKRIAVTAYFFAEQRGFAPHHELDDWLAAERSL